MNRAEKTELLQQLLTELSESFPGIESRAHVVGGAACIVRTRIPVWLLEQARRLAPAKLIYSKLIPHFGQRISRTPGATSVPILMRSSGKLLKTKVTSLNNAGPFSFSPGFSRVRAGASQARNRFNGF